MANGHTTRYQFAVIGLHWLMLLLIAAAYTFIELRELFPKGSEPRTLMKSLHFTMGLSVLFLVALRMVLRLLTKAPLITPLPPSWARHSSTMMHLLLYAFMIAMPLLGWMLLSSEGDPIRYLGLSLPSLLVENEPRAEQIEELHETLGEIGYFLIAAHAIAGLIHHYWFKDNTLKRMLPW